MIKVIEILQLVYMLLPNNLCTLFVLAKLCALWLANDKSCVYRNSTKLFKTVYGEAPLS